MKWQKIRIYQQLNIQTKQKQEEQRQNHGYRECFDGCHMRGGCGGISEVVRGLRSTNW